MSKRTEYINILMLCLGLLLITKYALADSLAPPRDYTKITENSEYVFVMLRPDGPYVESAQKVSTLPSDTDSPVAGCRVLADN